MGDAVAPPPVEHVDVDLAEHVAWALPDVAAMPDEWLSLLDDSGQVVLIESFWTTGADTRSADHVPLVPARTSSTTVRDLSAETVLWAGAVTDERHIVVGQVDPSTSA